MHGGKTQCHCNKKVLLPLYLKLATRFGKMGDNQEERVLLPTSSSLLFLACVSTEGPLPAASQASLKSGHESSCEQEPEGSEARQRYPLHQATVKSPHWGTDPDLTP